MLILAASADAVAQAQGVSIFLWICPVIFIAAGAYLTYVANKERGSKPRMRYQPFVNGLLLVGAGLFWAVVAMIVSA